MRYDVEVDEAPVAASSRRSAVAMRVVPSRRPRRWLWWRRLVPLGVASLLVLVVVVVVASGASVALTYESVRQTLPQTAVFPSAAPAAAPKPSGAAARAQNILLIGENGAVKATASSVRSGDADAILLLHVPADGKHLDVVSIPRDAYVAVPSHGSATVASTLSTGGLPLTVLTVETMLRTRIDHVAVVSFGGFSGLTDALGGVSMINPSTFTADGDTFARGRRTLSGAQALSYVRAGALDGLSTAQQVRNQQAYLDGVLKKLLSTGTLLNPIRLHGAVAAISPYLLTDSGLDAVAVAALSLNLRSLHSSDVVFLTAPVARTGDVEGHAIEYLDAARLARLADGLQHDTLNGSRG